MIPHGHSRGANVTMTSSLKRFLNEPPISEVWKHWPQFWKQSPTKLRRRRLGASPLFSFFNGRYLCVLKSSLCNRPVGLRGVEKELYIPFCSLHILPRTSLLAVHHRIHYHHLDTPFSPPPFSKYSTTLYGNNTILAKTSLRDGLFLASLSGPSGSIQFRIRCLIGKYSGLKLSP